MMNNILLLIVILGMSCCSTNRVAVDYFGQPEPSTTPVIFGEDLISLKGRFEHGISFTPDAKELAFGILNNDDSGVVYSSKIVNDSWTEPMIFEPLKNESAFLPYFTPDGKFLLYAQSKNDSDNLYATDIWRIERVGGDWSAPKKMETPISSISREANASMANDGTIYFSSNRNCEGNENCFAADLFYSELTEDGYKSVEEIADLNSLGDEESVFISPDQKYILFCRFSDSQTMMDLYISYRDHNNNWTKPRALDSTINSKDWDRRPFVSSDNKFLFFTRLQIGDKGLTESDIYWVNTSKVFKPFVYHPLTDITLEVGRQFELEIPTDYFKDIDYSKLIISINQDEFNWLEFDNNKMKLSGSPSMAGEYKLIFTAVDKHMNRTEDMVRIWVKKEF